MGNHSRINETNDSVRTNVWYELKRQGITIPFPIRTLHVERKKAPPLQEDQAEAFSILRGERLFDCLSEDQLNHMAHTMDYDVLVRTLPPNVAPAYDGLSFRF